MKQDLDSAIRRRFEMRYRISMPRKVDRLCMLQKMFAGDL